jgi:hypothetical protein
MPTPEPLAEEFEQHRAHLRAAAYRMLGSASEADDAVQESWIRPASSPEPLGAGHTPFGRSVILARGQSSRFDLKRLRTHPQGGSHEHASHWADDRRT